MWNEDERSLRGANASEGTGAFMARWLRVLWLPGVVFLLHLALASDLDIYLRYELTDELMHPAGGFAIAFAVARALDELRARSLVPDPGRPLRATLVVSLSATAAVLWELAEFVSDRYFGTRTLGDLEDTLADMALGIAGALVYLAVDVMMRGRAGRANR